MTDEWTSYKQLEKLDYIFGIFLCPSNDQNRRVGRAWIVANDHLHDPAFSVPLQMVICKEDGLIGIQIRDLHCLLGLVLI